MQQQLAAQLAALAAALPFDASQAQRRALVRAAIIHAPALRAKASAEQLRKCLQLVVATIHACQSATGTEVHCHSCTLSIAHRTHAAGPQPAFHVSSIPFDLAWMLSVVLNMRACQMLRRPVILRRASWQPHWGS